MTEPEPISFEARDARIDVAGTVVCDRLSLEMAGRRIVLAGSQAAGILAALCARGRVGSGVLRVDGHDVASGGHFGHVGLAPLDLPLPHRDTMLAFVTLGFRIAGLGRTEAPEAAHGVFEELGLRALETRKAASLSLPERRVVALAQAMVPSSKRMVVEAPLSGLETAAARFVLGVLAQVSRTRSVITSVLRTDPSSPERELLLGADCAAILSPTGAHWTGPPADLMKGARLFSATVRGPQEAFLDRLKEAGVQMSGNSPCLVLQLPEGLSTRTVVEAASESGATLTEFIPLWE